ncbi:MAG: hypothetical protein ACK4NX_02810 [Candidatus Paceibacteria bacterium]
MKSKTITVTEETTATKIFEPRLAVFRVKATFIAPYRKCKYLYLEPKDLKTKSRFIKHVTRIAKGWPNGTYYLKLSSGQVFARFDIVDGKVHKLYKDSPVTGKPYPVWAFWK